MALPHACDVTFTLVTLQRGLMWLQASVGAPPGNSWLLQRASEESLKEKAVYRQAAKD